MQVVDAKFVSNKKVILRYDIDVALENGQIREDFKLRAGITTLNLCLENASKVIIIGHLGRPARIASSPDNATSLRAGASVAGGPFATALDEEKGTLFELSAKPIKEWFEKELGQGVDFAENLEQADQSSNKIVLLENIRFFHGEVPGAEYHAACSSKTCDIDFAKRLAALGDFYVNEAFSSHNPAASTTILPTLLPHAVGLHFAKEVEMLTRVRENPKKPFLAIMGGAKVKDKLPVIEVLAKKADAVLVGGKLIHELRAGGNEKGTGPALPRNVLVGKLSEDGFDISPDTTESWQSLIKKAKMIVWNGPLGKFEDPKNDQSKKVAQIVLESGAQIVVGGGDTISLLGGLGLLGRYEETGFVSVGGGAMLKFLAEGTLPTIEALK